MSGERISPQDARWLKVSRIYHEALAREAPERPAFLGEACAGDDALHHEVESLLRNEGEAPGFLSEQAMHLGARMLSNQSSMIGQSIGGYEILSRLGSGGMGEVYRARDAKLGRDVAIKVLPEMFTADPERLRRFEREARVLASLNHPRIGAIYGLEHNAGVHALVLELIDGPTLAEMIAATPGQKLSIQESLRIALHVAEALEAAHEKGIIHRDLKPANIKVRRDGDAKVLDFGLAKALIPDGAGPDLTRTPTISVTELRPGAILGTPAYMSPEQARGKPIDKRTDIWAFGCVLFEMLSGRQAFPGETVSDTIAGILERDPDWSALPASTPPGARQLIERCLRKDPKARLHDIADARIELEALTEPSGQPPVVIAPGASPDKRRIGASLWKGAALLTLGLLGGAGAAGYLTREPASPAVSRFLVLPPDKAVFVTGGRVAAGGVISPDGRTLAFTARDAAGKIQLWVRPTDSLAEQPLAGTDDAAFPFWSPDSGSIAYFAQEKLLKISAAGGLPQTICVARNGRGGTWSRDGVIVFGSLATLSRVPAAGGEPMALTRLRPNDTDHRFPSFLPDGRRVLFYLQGRESGIYVASLDSGDLKRLIVANSPSSSGAIYTPQGYLLFARQGTLLAQSFDATSLQLSGDPFPIAESVESGIYQGVLAFSVSDDGVLAYGIGTGGRPDVQMAVFDRQGTLIEEIGRPGQYRGLDWAPDETRIATHQEEAARIGDVWLLSVPRGAASRFTFDPMQDNSSPIWSPDGAHLVFASIRAGKAGLYRKRSDGTGTEELLTQSDGIIAPMSYSPDGRSLVYQVADNAVVAGDLWSLDLADRKEVPLVDTPSSDDNHGQISPDGKWLAYDSVEGGRSEVYVKPFPAGAGKWQVSTDGGMFPRWRRDGRELFFMNALSGGAMVVVNVNGGGSTFERGVPKALFNPGYVDLGHGNSYHAFAVSADGRRFLISHLAPVTAGAASPQIAIVINWSAGLKN